MIKKELGVYLRVPGNDQQKTDLANTLPVNRIQDDFCVLTRNQVHRAWILNSRSKIFRWTKAIFHTA